MRTRKFRKKNKGILLGIKVLAIWYAVLISLVTLIGFTGAAFNDVESIESSLHVKWEVPPDHFWDKSSLSFIDDGGSCERIYAVVKNGEDSEAMAGPVNYEVYWIDKGNPKNGEIVYSGTIEPLGPGGSVTLEYTPDKSGNYKFKAYQRPEHPGQGVLWSDGPEGIDCGESQKTEGLEGESCAPLIEAVNEESSALEIEGANNNNEIASEEIKEDCTDTTVDKENSDSGNQTGDSATPVEDEEGTTQPEEDGNASENEKTEETTNNETDGSTNPESETGTEGATSDTEGAVEQGSDTEGTIDSDSETEQVADPDKK